MINASLGAVHAGMGDWRTDGRENGGDVDRWRRVFGTRDVLYAG